MTWCKCMSKSICPSPYLGLSPCPGPHQSPGQGPGKHPGFRSCSRSNFGCYIYAIFPDPPWTLPRVRPFPDLSWCPLDTIHQHPDLALVDLAEELQNWFFLWLPIFERHISFRLPLFERHVSFRLPLFERHVSFRLPIFERHVSFRLPCFESPVLFRLPCFERGGSPHKYFGFWIFKIFIDFLI